jgi:hypothetical protein
MKTMFDELHREISRTAISILNRLTLPTGDVPSPVVYRITMQEIARLEQKWALHVRLLSKGRQEGEEIADQLRLGKSARWARTPELGMNALRAQTPNTVRRLLTVLEVEKGCLHLAETEERLAVA